MDQILTDKELIEYQRFLDGKILISKYLNNYYNTEYQILFYKGKCYDVYNRTMIEDIKEINRKFILALLSCKGGGDNKEFDIKFHIEKVANKILILEDYKYYYINDDLIIINGFEKISLFTFICTIFNYINEYYEITDKNFIKLDKKLDTIEEEDSDDDYEYINLIKGKLQNV